MKTTSRRQRWNFVIVVLAMVAYLGMSVAAPRSGASSSYNFSPVIILLLGLTIVGLLFAIWWAGFYAWLQLDSYAHRLPAGPGRRAYDQMAQGMWFLAAGLIISSVLGRVNPFFRGDEDITAVLTQVNYYIIVLFPFLGFMKLRMGSLHLAVSAQAAMTARAKLVTVGPPVALLAAFYIYLAVTNTSPGAQTLSAGTIGFLVLWLTVGMVVASWALGLLAALNVERATYRGEGARHARPLVRLYSGILATTGGFIILDALLSLGATRLQALPVGALLLLLYGFIGVVGLGFLIVGSSVRQLNMSTPEMES